jgi:hypothetical protein
MPAPSWRSVFDERLLPLFGPLEKAMAVVVAGAVAAGFLAWHWIRETFNPALFTVILSLLAGSQVPSAGPSAKNLAERLQTGKLSLKLPPARTSLCTKLVKIRYYG